MGVLSGTVRIGVHSAAGREAAFNLVHAGEIFGEIALLALPADGRRGLRAQWVRSAGDEPRIAIKLVELLCARIR
jgi:CRP-like cAMP-binding protein